MRHGSKPGPAPYLDEAEEDELVQFLMKSAAMGCGKTKRELFSIVEKTIKMENFNGEGWWIRFIQRCSYGI